MSRSFIVLFILLWGASVGFAGADNGAAVSSEAVYAWWDDSGPVGEATVVRTQSGISAVVKSTDVPSGQAVTLWLIFFNNPEACDSTPCVLFDPTAEFLGDLFNPATGADFHFVAGHVTNGGKATFGAHLSVGDVAGSGFAEFGLPPVALSNPYGAEVVLALHSHGPKLTGRALKEQISSYGGGCLVFLGAEGFATGPEDVPDEEGECSTFQYSQHVAP